MLKQVITEMVQNASKEIDFEFCEGSVELILANMSNSFVEVDLEGPITWQLMSNISDTIKEWQEHTKLNG